MMKRTIYIMLACLALLCAGCSGTSYSSLRNEEDKMIENYISRHQINVLTEWPGDDYVWAEKDYFLVPELDDLYFHLRYRGDSLLIEGEDTMVIEPVAEQETIVMRYKKFALTDNPDTLSNWSTLDQAYPTEFKYLNTSTCEASGWHIAVKYMKYHNAECQIICPSRWGFDADQNSVTPYCYIMKMLIKR